MKESIKSNVLVFFVYLLISVLGYFCNVLNTNFDQKYMVCIGVLYFIISTLLFYILGYFLVSRIFSGQDSEIKKLSSFILILVVNLSLWIYCFIFSLDKGWSVLIWSYYIWFNLYSSGLYSLINSNALNIDIPILFLLMPILPILLIWVGMKTKPIIQKIKNKKSSLAESK